MYNKLLDLIEWIEYNLCDSAVERYREVFIEWCDRRKAR